MSRCKPWIYFFITLGKNVGEKSFWRTNYLPTKVTFERIINYLTLHAGVNCQQIDGFTTAYSLLTYNIRKSRCLLFPAHNDCNREFNCFKCARKRMQKTNYVLSQKNNRMNLSGIFQGATWAFLVSSCIQKTFCDISYSSSVAPKIKLPQFF